MTSNKDSVTNNSREHLVGRVKWFNNKAGYGFISITDGERSGTDIFVHHSTINVDNHQYKYLVQGEYVEFDMVKTDSSNHEWQASNVSGIKGGKLMCETRYEFNIARNEYKTTKGVQTTSTSNDVTSQPSQREPRQVHPKQRTSGPRLRGEGPRESENKEWTLKSNKKSRVNTIQPVSTTYSN
jgi:CspA family cold shock protein